ncbi:MAG: thioredoxin-related protein [Crocinitomicaceae bacterium]|jgi:thioredoxin-related protein
MQKKLLIIALVLPTLALVASSYIINKDKSVKVGKKAPMMDVKMEGIDGNEYALSELAGENGLLVVFSCNTCPFVVGSDKFEGWEKQYNDLAAKAAEGKIGFVLINSNEGKREGADSKIAMMKHAEEMGYTMNYVVDADSKLADAFGAKTTPHLFAIDGKGKVAFTGSIDNSWDSARTEPETYALDVIAHLADGKILKEKTSSPRGCSIKRK